MKISDYLTLEHVVILNAATKVEALDELVSAADDFSENISAEELARAVWEREKMMSTGIGQGLGIPHVRLPGLADAVMAVGVSRAGIPDYESLDNQPVHIIVLIAAPQGRHEIYIRLLAKVANILKQDDIRKAISEADDAAEIYRILTEGKV
ncbi:MAG: PTS sugar transporter subunit IIA [Planctomycetota bacterium]|nr:PTS sugar transporter subunit IIA [Planctomycetota bacterium]